MGISCTLVPSIFFVKALAALRLGVAGYQGPKRLSGFSNNIWLVVLTILKNMKVNGKDYPIYYGK